MKRKTPLLLVVLALNGCVINSVRPLSADDTVSTHRATIVYGVKMEGRWNYPGFAVQLDEYNLNSSEITGNCFTYNRASAKIPAIPGTRHYFAFDVPAGHYVYSPFNGTQLSGGNIRFEAPAGKSVYVGEFVFTQNQSVVLLRNLTEAKSAINAALPGLADQLSPADTVIVNNPHIFLCVP